MIPRVRMLVLAGAASVAAGTAGAQDRPVTTPTRDVDVTYQADAGGQKIEQRSRFGVTAKKVRIDTPTPGLYVIVDRGAQTMDMVSDADHGFMPMPFDPARTVDGVSPNQAFTRKGTDTIAGVPCTDWQTTDAGGQTVVVCLTADGVLLRVKLGNTVLVQASKVAYGPIPAAAFAIPPGYQRRTPPPPPTQQELQQQQQQAPRR